MPKIPVQNIDLLVHPFYKLAKQANHFRLTPKQREFALFLSNTWKKAVVAASRKKNNLFILVDFTIVNPELEKIFEDFKAFSKGRLGKRFRICHFALSKKGIGSGRRQPVSITVQPFNNVVFLRGKQIVVNTWGESFGNCPVTEAKLLQAALHKEEFLTKVVRRTERTVRESHSMKNNTYRMNAGPKPMHSLSQNRIRKRYR